MISKEQARYQDHPKITQHCGSCSMFRAPASCTLVRGEISKSAWCRYWEPKTEKKAGHD